MTLPLQSDYDQVEKTGARLVAVNNQYSKNADSSLLVNLAVCLRNLGNSACVFESAHVSQRLKYIENQIDRASTSDLINGDILIDELMVKGPVGVDIIPYSDGIAEFAHLGAEQKQNLFLAFTQLQNNYDFILIDTAAGISLSTISELLGAGALVITITPAAQSLSAAFNLLREIKQRVFQHPVKVIVNLVAGENEAKRIIARLSVAVRTYLGSQCGSMSFFIFDMPMLEIMSTAPLVSVEYPDSAPSQCMTNIVLRLTEEDYAGHRPQARSMQRYAPGFRVDYELNAENDWVSQALNSLKSEPAAVIDPIMQRLNAVWNERKLLQDESQQEHQISTIELDLLNLRTAIHFAGMVDTDKQDKAVMQAELEFDRQ